MCDICEKWDKKQINSKEAMNLIGKAAGIPKIYSKVHLTKLASRILDNEVPFSETDKKAEKAFWKRTHRRSNEEP